MDCEQFRSRYSDFADELLDERSEVELRRHMGDCPECRRLHAAYRTGCRELRHLRCLSPRADFSARLSARIGREEAGEARAPALSRPVAVLALALTVALGGAGTALVLLRATTGNGGAVAATAPVGGAHRNPFMLRFAGDTSLDYPGRFPIIPVSRDSFSTRPVRPAQFEITVDWMQP